MHKKMLMLCTAVLVVFFACTAAMAFEITDEDVSGTSTEEVTVASAPDPGLVGFFKSDGSDVFAYALIEKDGQYGMFVKIRGKYEGWAQATIDGKEIVFGKKGKAKIVLEDDGSVSRLFNEKKTPLVKTR